MSFYFYDYETFGINPKTSRIAQFAGIRTDENLNIINEKMLYCQPSNDFLPSPEAVAITGITPQLCEKQGVKEVNFIKQINAEFSTANTCTVGYNNIRFDDEFTRYALYRNFLDPYAWSWKNGNSRWDILDVVRMCYALKPETMNWVIEKNKPIFKLDRLAPANNIHTKAHDALEDVRATIAVAKIIKDKQTKLFDYAYSLRDKKVVKNHIKLFEPMLHTSGMYDATLGCTRRVAAIGYSELGNSAIIFNLDQDPSILLDLNIEELQKLRFIKNIDLSKGIERLQIKELHFNKSPMFVSNIKKLSEKTIKHLQIDMDKTNQHLNFLKNNQRQITDVIRQLFTKPIFDKNTDAEQDLYTAFLSHNDRILANKINQMNVNQLANFHPDFENNNLQNLLLSFKARNYPQSLNDSEQERWFEVVQNRIQFGKSNFLNIEEFEKQLQSVKQQYLDKSHIWQQLERYSENLI